MAWPPPLVRINTVPTPQEAQDVLSIVRISTCWLLHAVHWSALTIDWEQPVSTSAEHCTPLTCTLITSNAAFTGQEGASHLVPRPVSRTILRYVAQPVTALTAQSLPCFLIIGASRVTSASAIPGVMVKTTTSVAFWVFSGPWHDGITCSMLPLGGGGLGCSCSCWKPFLCLSECFGPWLAACWFQVQVLKTLAAAD